MTDRTSPAEGTAEQLISEIVAAINPELVPLQEAADAVSLRLDRLEGR